MISPMKRIIFLFLSLICVTHISAQTPAALEEQARRTTDPRERMNLYMKSGEKYMSSNPQRASQVAHQAYNIATTDLNDNTIAMKAAYLNGEGFARLGKWGEAKTRYYRSKESAEKAKDTEGAIKAITKMGDMAKREGNAAEAEMYANVVKDLRKNTKPPTKTTISAPTSASSTPTNSEGGHTVSSVKLPPPLSPSANRPAPSNQAEMNAMRLQFKEQTEQLEKERQQILSEVNILQKEKEMLSSGMMQLKVKEKELTEQTEQAKEAVEKTTKQLVVVEEEKLNLDRVAKKRQKMVEALKSEKALDALAYAQDKQEQEFELQKAQNLRNVLLLVLGSALIFAFLFYQRFKENQKQKRVLEEKNKIIEDERLRSDDLLRNILPVAIAQELKQNGKAKAQRYEKASVLFIDFKNFTAISEKLGPEQLVYELDSYFKAFDFIISQYKLEKIKTIGDAYMCASGLSDRISTPVNIVKAALELQQYLYEMKADKLEHGQPVFEARIGIHTGPVVAGVVGVNKFAYDIWGDTVNIAARMQEACEPGQINISETTYREVQYAFRCHHRGRVPAKNKGAVDMYYVGGIIAS
jgi:adenylate cyclase